MKIAFLGVFPVLNETTKEINESRPQTWNINLVEGLSKLNQEVHFYTLNRHYHKDFTLVISDNLKIHYIHAPRGHKYLTFYQYGKIKIHGLLNKLQPDFVLGIGTEHEYPYIAVTSKFPSAIYIHHLLTKHYELTKSKKNIKSLFNVFFENRALKLSTNILSTTEFFRNGIDLNNKRFAILANSVNHIYIDQPNLEKSDQFLFVGKADDGRKRLEDLLDAMAMILSYHKNLKLKIIGPMNDLFLSKIKKKIDKLNLLRSAIILGFIKDNKLIAEEMSKSIATCVISDFEGFGMPIIESLAVGTPVIASNVGGIPYILEDYKSGFLVEPRDIAGIFKKMKLLLDSPSLQQDMGKYGRKIVKNKYTNFTIANKLLNLITEFS